MTGLTPNEIGAAIHAASASLPSDQRATFKDRASSWLAQYACPTMGTVQEVISICKRDLCLAAAPPEHRP